MMSESPKAKSNVNNHLHQDLSIMTCINDKLMDDLQYCMLFWVWLNIYDCSPIIHNIAKI